MTEEGWEWEKLDQISSQITNANRHINRVLLLLNPPASALRATVGKPSGNILPGQLQTAYLTRERVERLRVIDALVTEEITRAGLYHKIWQFPVVLVPFGQRGQESIVLRPVVSQEAMTANFACLPRPVLARIVKRILVRGDISYIFYDLTHKPPGTIEWE